MDSKVDKPVTFSKTACDSSFADFGSAAARVSDGDGAAEADSGGRGVEAGLAQDAQEGAHAARPGDGGGGVVRHREAGTDRPGRFTLSRSNSIFVVKKG